MSQSELGWRTFTVPMNGEPRLYLDQDRLVLPRRPLVAQCGRCVRNCPGAGCRCGIYSARTVQRLYTMPYRPFFGERDGRVCVVARVASWGLLVEGGDGWRAEKCYPVHLIVPLEAFRILAPLRDAYRLGGELGNVLKPAGWRLASVAAA